jgi:4'-phosphopantetheinyl transferase
MARALVYWLDQRAAAVPDDDEWLTAAERRTLADLRVRKRRDDWRLGRWAAKRAVCAYWQTVVAGEGTAGTLIATATEVRYPTEGRIEIRTAVSGAPEAFIDGRPGPVVISISHTADTALCAVAPAGVVLGCDVERIEPRTAAFVRDYFTAAECAMVGAASASERDHLVALVWSAKESVLKALREGLRSDTRDVEAAVHGRRFSVNPDWQPVGVRHLPSRHDFGGWWRAAGGTVMTLVAAPPPERPIRLEDSSGHCT